MITRMTAACATVAIRSITNPLLYLAIGMLGAIAYTVYSLVQAYRVDLAETFLALIGAIVYLAIGFIVPRRKGEPQNGSVRIQGNQ